MSSSTADLGMPPVLAPEDAGARSVLLAAPRGYCAGVDRAVITVEKALDLYGAPVYVRKQIVHNRHVVATLEARGDRKSTRLNSSHANISYAVFCLKKKKQMRNI